jgi:hypothetical protein
MMNKPPLNLAKSLAEEHEQAPISPFRCSTVRLRT